MNHKHRAILHALFAHPISSNIDPKSVKAVLEELGAATARDNHGHLTINLNNHSHRVHDNHHSFSRDEVVALRKFLTEAGVDPVRDYPL